MAGLATDFVEDMKFWVKTQGPWWLTSVTAHAVVGSILLLILGTVAAPHILDEAPAFEARTDTEIPEPEIEHFDVGDTSIEPTELNTDTLTLADSQIAQEEQINTTPDDPFEEAGGGGIVTDAQPTLGGLGGFDVKAIGSGPAVKGPGGVGVGVGYGTGPGSGGAGSGFGGRGTGVHRAMLGSGGGTKGSERAVAAALNWLARHQGSDGSWSLEKFPKQCKGDTCGGPGNGNSDAGATAMALLPFLAAGQTHDTKGPYKKTIYSGLYWLTSHQKPDGNLAAGSPQLMYTHGLASICLCEAYGLSRDRQIGAAAQQAIHFIETAQNKGTGGWRYQPGDPGDTSVVGWQVMALKSAQMAGLSVNSTTLDGAKKWLKSASSSKGGLFAYEAGGGATPVMSAVGLLCTQYLGAERQDPGIQEGMQYLMGNQPDNAGRNIYYWYYATQVLHNLPGSEWDTWNRKMRKMLIDSQEKEGCAAGSWDPMKPGKDAWAEPGGRIMVTSLSCLTLEVYYRYLPLYKLDGKGANDPLKGAPAKQAAVAKPAEVAEKK